MQPFRRIAGKYRLLNSILSLGLDRYWRHRAVSSLAVVPGQRLLDVGCGPGDVLRLINREGVFKVGLDPEPRMLMVQGEASYQKVMGIAERLPFGNALFHRLTSAFAVRNFSDRAAAFSEFRRVLRPGGRGAILEFSPPDNTVPGVPVKWFVRGIIPVVGGLVSGDREAYLYLSRSIMSFPAPETIVGELRRAGFADVTARRLPGSVTALFTFVRADE